MKTDIFEIINNIKPADSQAVAKAILRQKDLLKPLGSLGVLEDISVKLAGITGRVKNNIDKKILFLFGADNGVYEEGVSGSPQSLTRTLMQNYAQGEGCAINVICDHFKTDLKLVDMGIIGEAIPENCDNVKLMKDGTRNFLKSPAMDEEITLKAITVGVNYAKYAQERGYSVIGGGEVGMGNTATSAACILACAGVTQSDPFIGRGGGLSDELFHKKKQVIAKALKLYNFKKDEPLRILSCVGGLDIAALTGLFIGSAYYRMPIVIDGIIAACAALLAYRFSPLTKDFMIASHVSEEPAYTLAVEEIGLEPMLKLKMRLGEGSGCPFAFSVIEGAAAIMNNMATFSETQVEDGYRKNMKMK